MFDVILVAVDGSEHGLHAARVAGDLARAVTAKELLIVVAYEPVPGYVKEPNLSEAIATRKAQAQQILQQVQDIVGSIPAQTTPQMVEGSIAEVILTLANTHRCDVIVMGSRGFGRLEEAVLGSNSQKVASRAPCPVLIVR
ncbi:MAG TPA: universal stress protein [Anaerolineales bacterium]